MTTEKAFLFDIGPAGRKASLHTRSGLGRAKSGCELCGLHTRCKSPRMEPHGNGKLGIYIIGQSPGMTEDDEGRQFIGESGEFLEKRLASQGVSIDEDCWLDNAVQCCPGKRKIDAKHVRACRPRVVKHIETFKPSLILALGAEAMQSIFQGLPLAPIMSMRGRLIPSHEFGVWVAPLLHPSYVLRQGEPKDLIKLYNRDIKHALEVLD